ncbi:GAF domain-containing protein [Alkalimarinus coralli]|uniref:GAF domain-containing protein n=1 Tax=Alkalimarinus coralli TaxID=2935863 RepID=UPI00202ADFC0|nr:GAF domain-containing protein [Alkalimarinus coralli]
MTPFAELPTDVQLSKNLELTNAITHALTQFIAEANPYILFNGLLDSLLQLTESEYGFIGEVFYNNTGKPYIQSYATTNISWSQETRELYEKTEKQGLTFSKLNTLYGAILKTGKFVISNDPANDPRSGGLPKGHPPLNKFLGIPFFSGDSLLGVVGIANRKAGYDESLIEYLDPFLTTCGNLIQAYRNNQQRQMVEQELQSYKRRLSALMAKRAETNTQQSTNPPLSHDAPPISLGNGYAYIEEQQTLILNNEVLPLTKKESLLLQLLVEHRNQITDHRTIESFVWKDVVVSESSIRALVLRLRKKLPGVTIKTISGIGFLLAI